MSASTEGPGDTYAAFTEGLEDTYDTDVVVDLNSGGEALDGWEIAVVVVGACLGAAFLLCVLR